MNETTYPVELAPPDLAPYRDGNTGIAWVWRFDGPEPGPNVVVNGLTHGNELCGAAAIDFLFRQGVRPRRGRLTLVLANVAAYSRFDPKRPTQSRYIDEDFNRLWSEPLLDGRASSAELSRARRLRPVYEAADYLLDLHSMQHDGPPLILCGITERARKLAQDLGVPRWIVADRGHSGGRRLIDYTPFADPAGSRTALLVECGQHWAVRTASVAIETTLRFLAHLGMIAPETATPWLSPEPLADQRLIEVTHAVTVTTDSFAWVRDFGALEIVAARGTPIGRDGAVPITTPYDDCVLVMPARHASRGQTAVRLGRIRNG